jgi:hypothetical protein
MNEIPPVAIPVFSAENYQIVLEMLAEGSDEAQAHVPYEEYVAGAEEHATELQASGVTVHRVPVHPDRLRYWCEKHNRPLDREAISLFAMAELNGEVTP